MTGVEQRPQEAIEWTPSGETWNELVGPFYTKEVVQDQLGVPEEELADLAERREILPLISANDVTLFPSFQFKSGQHGTLEVIPGFSDALSKFDRDRIDNWVVASTLNKKRPELGEKSIVTALSDENPTVAIRTAERISATFHR